MAWYLKNQYWLCSLHGRDGITLFPVSITKTLASPGHLWAHVCIRRIALSYFILPWNTAWATVCKNVVGWLHMSQRNHVLTSLVDSCRMIWASHLVGGNSQVTKLGRKSLTFWQGICRFYLQTTYIIFYSVDIMFSEILEELLQKLLRISCVNSSALWRPHCWCRAWTDAGFAKDHLRHKQTLPQS